MLVCKSGLHIVNSMVPRAPPAQMKEENDTQINRGKAVRVQKNVNLF